MARSAALWTIAVLAFIWWLRAASTLLVPVALAMCISYALEPVIGLLTRVMPRILATSLLLLLLLGAGSWGLYTLRDEAAAAIDALPQAARRFHQLIAGDGSPGPASSIQQVTAELQGGGSHAKDASPQGGSAQPSTDAPRAPTATRLLERGATSALALAGNVVTIVFLVFFLLAAGDHFSDRAIEIAGDAEHRKIAAQIVRDINRQIQRFLLVRAATGTMVAVATWGVLVLFGTPQAAVWGLLAGVFNSIPYFGPVIASGGLLVVGLVQSGQLSHALWMSGAALVITSLEGWLLTPPLLGKAERMSAVVIFLGLLFWTWVWGPWGTLLAVPMLVIMKAVADHVAPLRWVSRLMAP
jgi:predicted PurR-regulated permease PerM